MFFKGNFCKNSNFTQDKTLQNTYTKLEKLGNEHEKLFSELMNVYPKLQMFGPIARQDYIMGQSDFSSLLYNCHLWVLYKS